MQRHTQAFSALLAATLYSPRGHSLIDPSRRLLSPWKLHPDLTLVFPSRADQGSKVNKVLPPPPTLTPTVASFAPAAEEFTARRPAVCAAGEQIGEVSGEERERCCHSERAFLPLASANPSNSRTLSTPRKSWLFPDAPRSKQHAWCLLVTFFFPLMPSLYHFPRAT